MKHYNIKGKELMKENIIKGVANLVCILQRLVYTILFFICICIVFILYIPINILVLIPICGIIWIISGKSYYESVLDFPDKLYVVDDFLIKSLRINNKRKINVKC